MRFFSGWLISFLITLPSFSKSSTSLDPLVCQLLLVKQRDFLKYADLQNQFVADQGLSRQREQKILAVADEVRNVRVQLFERLGPSSTAKDLMFAVERIKAGMTMLEQLVAESGLPSHATNSSKRILGELKSRISRAQEIRLSLKGADQFDSVKIRGLVEDVIAWWAGMTSELLAILHYAEKLSLHSFSAGELWNRVGGLGRVDAATSGIPRKKEFDLLVQASPHQKKIVEVKGYLHPVTVTSNCMSAVLHQARVTVELIKKIEQLNRDQEWVCEFWFLGGISRKAAEKIRLAGCEVRGVF